MSGVDGDHLTDGEARIALLAARGRRNAEIAFELELSPKTVEWNLTRVYRKLGVRSRTELAVRVAGGDLPLPERDERSTP